MKKLLITILLMGMLFSCSSNYFTVMDIKTGELITIKNTVNSSYIKQNDTIICVHRISKETGKDFGYSIYGIYIDTIPNSDHYNKYIKTVRL